MIICATPRAEEADTTARNAPSCCLCCHVNHSPTSTRAKTKDNASAHKYMNLSSQTLRPMRPLMNWKRLLSIFMRLLDGILSKESVKFRGQSCHACRRLSSVRHAKSCSSSCASRQSLGLPGGEKNGGNDKDNEDQRRADPAQLQ